MLVFPDPSVSTEYTDPNGSAWEFNGTGWVRQPESSGGGGGTSGDGMWPSLPKPSIDLLATRQQSGGNGMGTGFRFLKIAEDGALSDYDFVTLNTNLNKVEFCPSDTFVAASTTSSIVIYDYSKSPFEEVARFTLPWEIGDFAWSANGTYIFCSQYQGRSVEVWKNAPSGWEVYAPNSRAVDDLTFTEESDDPEQMILPYYCLQICAVNDPKNEEAFLLSHNYKPSETQFFAKTHSTVNLIKATPSGCVRLAGDSGFMHEKGYITTQFLAYTHRVLSHPHSGMYVYYGLGAMRDKTDPAHIGLGMATVFQDGSGECFAEREYAERWVGAADNSYNSGSGDGSIVESGMISPSGNYLIAKRQDRDDASVFRIHTNGMLERLQAITPSTSGTCYFQWSADEKYIYEWCRAKINRYEFNDGSPVLVDTQISNMANPSYSAGTANNYVAIRTNSHMNRSKS